MKQIIQNLSDGQTSLKDVPTPLCSDKHALVRTHASLISLGTEKMLVEFGQASFLNKARKQPDKVKMVLEKAKTDGVLSTIDAVKSKLNQPIPMGYCSAGVVLESRTDDFKVGDRVVTNGPHAEAVCISKNLIALLPDNVTFEQAIFTPVASIGLQGIRLVGPQIGETVVVMGLGLIGLLTVQILVGQGCRVIGTDFDQRKLELARKFGAETVVINAESSPVSQVMALNNGVEVDAVIIAASTSSSDPVAHAARMTRKRGKIVLVGVTGLALNRADFYEKELTFQVSCSYGPGRYDPSYEEGGSDYPYGFVRWTEQRNFTAVLRMMSQGILKTEDLVSEVHDFQNAENVYADLAENKDALGVVLSYSQAEDEQEVLDTKITLRDFGGENPTFVVAGVLGAGNYASRILIPGLQKTGARLKSICSSGGMSASHHGDRFGFETASSNIDDIINDESINLVVIATRHNSHAKLAIKALEAGKSVFVEKPLALTQEELDGIVDSWNSLSPETSLKLMVGFNRRFAPQVQTMKRLLADVNEPKSFSFIMNAGAIPAESWVQSREIGGGRIVGEACHLIDLMRFLADSPISSVYAKSMAFPDSSGVAEDKACITLGFEDGSIGTINYFANGDKTFSKERYEVFAGGKILQLDNFRKLKGFGWPSFSKQGALKQDKGQNSCIASFVDSLNSGSVESPIPFEQILEVSRASITAADMIRSQ